ncbi:MAG: hypothetical protein A2Z01_01165 [Betaproteobacteria bacterium RBG_16_58_11]|nr:MAG: hypothetical protein A2Z01_01165 [Betaproteobacteria bacterium RBG_16_58_11]
MASRLASRLPLIAAALRATFTKKCHKPSHPARILIAHHLLLGDTLMLTPLLAKLRARYPAAEIVMTVRPELVALYEKRPYGVIVLPYDPKHPASFAALRQNKGFDLALIPGDNRYSWLARALDARWIVAFVGDRPAYKNWAVDTLIPFPQTPVTVADMMTQLVDGLSPAPYQPASWPAPTYDAFDFPDAPYAVLHVGAGSVLRRWQPEKWRELITHLETRGLRCVFSGAANDREHIAQIDPKGKRPSYAGNTSLPQLWHLLQNAALLLCPDTGIAHLGRIVGVPTVALYGQGSPLLFGAGEFWRDAPFQAVWLADFPCRDQKVLFKREAEWIRRCSRTPRECPEARCMQGIDLAPVLDAVDQLLNNARP